MWEYKVLMIEFEYNSQLIDRLNEEGEQNWEICNMRFIKDKIFPYSYKYETVFKRKKNELVKKNI